MLCEIPVAARSADLTFLASLRISPTSSQWVLPYCWLVQAWVSAGLLCFDPFLVSRLDFCEEPLLQLGACVSLTLLA